MASTSRSYEQDFTAKIELANILVRYSENGIPPLKHFDIVEISEDAQSILQCKNSDEMVDSFCHFTGLTPKQESRQLAIKELIVTEIDYIKHLRIITDVFMATAHDLQDKGKLLEIDSSKLFSNIPDVLNSNLNFFETAMMPLIRDARDNKHPFDLAILSTAFYTFRDAFKPYEQYLNEHRNILCYLMKVKDIQSFHMYIFWCQEQAICNRLNLGDLLVKPMQRMTKYPLLIERILKYSSGESEQSMIQDLATYVKSYTMDLNRSVRHREELDNIDSLIRSLGAFEMQTKDEEMDKIFKEYCNTNLGAAMLGCFEAHRRTLIYEGDYRMRDSDKDPKEVHLYVLTDILLICRKMTLKGSSQFSYKMIRPKIFVERLVNSLYYSKTNKEKAVSAHLLVLDEFGSSEHAYIIYEPSRDAAPNCLKILDTKLREAKMTYQFALKVTRNPICLLTEIDVFESRPEDHIIEKDAKERVATMLYGVDMEHELSLLNTRASSYEAEGGPKPPGYRHPMFRSSTGESSRNSRYSEYQSAASYEEPSPLHRSIHRHVASLERSPIPDEATTIIVNVQRSTSNVQKKHTLAVQTQDSSTTSLPDFYDYQGLLKPIQSSSSPSASEKLYQSHSELMKIKHPSFQSTQSQRGISFPPPSTTRGLLRRGIAFSRSFKLSRMSNVHGDHTQKTELKRNKSPTSSGFNIFKSKDDQKDGLSKSTKKGKGKLSPNASSSGEASRGASPTSDGTTDKSKRLLSLATFHLGSSIGKYEEKKGLRLFRKCKTRKNSKSLEKKDEADSSSNRRKQLKREDRLYPSYSSAKTDSDNESSGAITPSPIASPVDETRRNTVRLATVSVPKSNVENLNPEITIIQITPCTTPSTSNNKPPVEDIFLGFSCSGSSLQISGTETSEIQLDQSLNIASDSPRMRRYPSSTIHSEEDRDYEVVEVPKRSKTRKFFSNSFFKSRGWHLRPPDL